MKKVLAIFALAALMLASLGNGGFSTMASYYGDIEEAMPAQPVE